VQGTSRSTNAFEREVRYHWDLALQPGWNLVTAEQTPNLGQMTFRSGATPGDLQWYAADPRKRAVNLP
jgi:hypothetical protein